MPAGRSLHVALVVEARVVPAWIAALAARLAASPDHRARYLHRDRGRRPASPTVPGRAVRTDRRAAFPLAARRIRPVEIEATPAPAVLGGRDVVLDLTSSGSRGVPRGSGVRRLAAEARLAGRAGSHAAVRGRDRGTPRRRHVRRAPFVLRRGRPGIAASNAQPGAVEGQRCLCAQARDCPPARSALCRVATSDGSGRARRGDTVERGRGTPGRVGGPRRGPTPPGQDAPARGLVHRGASTLEHGPAGSRAGLGGWLRAARLVVTGGCRRPVRARGGRGHVPLLRRAGFRHREGACLVRAARRRGGAGRPTGHGCSKPRTTSRTRSCSSTRARSS